MKPFSILLLKEMKDIFLLKGALLFLIISSFIFGYSFFTAVNLYSNASIAAVNNPLYARGFEPAPGIFVPTYGGLFILFSLFLPFVIIPLISLEKKQNTLAILTQIPFSFGKILTAKIISGILFLLFILFLTIPGVIIWRGYGGHVPWNELLLLMLGYLLYGIFVISVSFGSASLFNNTASASIFSIGVIISSWVIDFSKNMMNVPPVFHLISEWTLTRTLKYFEKGIFSFTAIMYFVALSAAFFILSYILLRFDLKYKWKWMSITVIAFILTMLIIPKFNINFDVTKSRRNSFPVNIAKATKKVPSIGIDVYMRKTDSRFRDYTRSFLDKLALIRNDVKVNMMTGDALKKNYGLFVYKVNGKSEQTYSNSEEEIFPIIFGLAGVKINKNGKKESFPGYPLVTNKKQSAVILYVYFLFIPLGLILVYVIKNFNLIKGEV